MSKLTGGGSQQSEPRLAETLRPRVRSLMTISERKVITAHPGAKVANHVLSEGQGETMNGTSGICAFVANRN
jgi:hypothetical protein